MKHLSAISVNIGLCAATIEKRQMIKIKVRHGRVKSGEGEAINRLISIGKTDQMGTSRPDLTS